MSKEKRSVPKLRFPGFTEDWEQCKLESLGKIITGNTPSTLKKEYWSANSEGVVWITPTDINSVKTDCSERLLTEEGASQARIVPANSILVTCIASIGKNTINTVEAAFNQQINALVPHLSNSYFILTMLNNMESAFKRVAGTSATSIINKKEFGQLSALLPSVEEQNKIGEIFELIDKSITLHQRKLEHLNLKKKALLQKLFPKNGERYPELRFPGFTDAWEQRKLGDIATFSKGNGYSKSDLTPSGDPIILYGRLYTNYETTISNVDTFVELKDKSLISQGGEVIVPASGETAEDISRASVVKKQGIIIGGDLNVIKANHLLDPTFLALTISNGEQQKELSKRAQGKSVVHLHNSDLQEVNLTFPLLNEQKEISTLFEKMDNIITLHQRKLEHLQLQKKALLQQMFV